jgi:hypothetical protein
MSSIELLDGIFVDVPDAWHYERDGDTALLLADPTGDFVTNVFAHETALVDAEQLADGISELPGGVVLEQRNDGHPIVRFGYATDAESLTGLRLLVERPGTTSVLIHATIPTRRLASDASAIDAVLQSVTVR